MDGIQPKPNNETVLAAPGSRLRRPLDPRYFQIAILSALLLFGTLQLGFDIGAAQIAVTLGAALLTQYAGSRFLTRLAFDPKSALISGLSLCLLLRTNGLGWAALGSLTAVGSKFLIRMRGKHLFNPTNGALVVLLLATDAVWVSSAQWGSKTWLAFLVACAGGLVIHRSWRSDVTYAFLATYLVLLFGRALWLGDPLAIPLRQLQSGALVLFAFFMISDPKTTPDSRAGRLLFGAVVALGASFVTFVLYRPNGLLYSLAAFSLAVPVLDRLMPGTRYQWNATYTRPAQGRPLRELSMKYRNRLSHGLLFGLALLALPAEAFCGFYVAKGDTKLFNRASQVALVRDGDRTVLTMANDFKGDVRDFAMVIPVPTFISREQIHVAEKALLDHLDAYSAPRLVEYFDSNPCQEGPWELLSAAPGAAVDRANVGGNEARARSLGVSIEASYTVGEYDILILSAKESNGLVIWLQENGYRLPGGAEPVVGSYLKQGMRFFVAKVNLEEQAKAGTSYLRPLQVAYESPKFMLPIRLGTVNADGPQELFIYALTKTGRVETTNYRTVRLPSDAEIPVFVKEDFGRFYKDAFGRLVEREHGTAVFLEYAWDMGWCDPCAADPLAERELKELGVFWLEGGFERRGGGANVFLTRLHVRYDRAHFPEDLSFQETGDRGNFQGRFVLRHPWTGSERCDAAERYRRELPKRFETEAQTLARLTGWPIEEIRRRMKLPAEAAAPEEPWWKRLWNDGR